MSIGPVHRVLPDWKRCDMVRAESAGNAGSQMLVLLLCSPLGRQPRGSPACAGSGSPPTAEFLRQSRARKRRLRRRRRRPSRRAPWPCARLITWNWHRGQVCAWQQPPVTWVNSSAYDGDLSAELRALRPPPPAHTLHTPPHPHPQYYLPPSGLLHVAHSSVQWWNMAECADKWRRRRPPSVCRAGSSTHQLETVKGGLRKG